MAVAGEEEEEAESGEEAEEEQQQQQVLHQLARPNLRHTVNTLPNSNSNSNGNNSVQQLLRLKENPRCFHCQRQLEEQVGKIVGLAGATEGTAIRPAKSCRLGWHSR